MRRALVFALVTAALFLIGMTALSPSLLPWWFQSPSTQVFDCTPAVRWAVSRVLLSQGIALGIGFVVGIVLAVMTRKKTVAALPSPAPTTTVTTNDTVKR